MHRADEIGNLIPDQILIPTPKILQEQRKRDPNFHTFERAALLEAQINKNQEEVSNHIHIELEI